MDSSYTPPQVWTVPEDMGGTWGSINRPTAGAREEKELPVGKHPLQLYSLATPNGIKVTILLEELLAAGVKEAEYDAHKINIISGEQFGSGFVAVNPNSKIPALVDCSKSSKVNVFESANIMLYLADKFGRFVPPTSNPGARTNILNWVFWVQGCAPILGGGFGHFYQYAPTKQEYPINRFTMEIKRQLDVLDKELAKTKYLGGEEYTIADMNAWSWYGPLVLGELYGKAAVFLEAEKYTNVMRWAKEIFNRAAVQRGRIVNRSWGEEWEKCPERHAASDIDEALKKKS